MSETILIVDDVAENLRVLSGMLEPLGYDLRVGRNGQEAIDRTRSDSPDLVLLDVNMPDLDGFEVCSRLKADDETRDIPIIFLTARVEPDDLVTGFRNGGVDYITKPFNEEELKVRIRTQLELRRLVRDLNSKVKELEDQIARGDALTVERDQLAERLSFMTAEEAKRWGLDGFIGRSKTLQDILEDIRRLQQAGTTSVMITGESGTGKELVARAIHFGSDRQNGPFIPVNCSAVPHDLADSLFFGHTKGAFTGADRDKQGYFELASGGTLFLDELGEMPLDLQVKLLRVLESRKVMPVGSGTERNVDVRILSATNIDLQAAVNEGRFRQDLYFRLAGYPVHVPPLRDRREDIPLLASHFLSTISEDMGLHDPVLTPEASEALSGYAFPGNIRELKSVIERALVASGGSIAPEHLHLAADLAGVAPAQSGSFVSLEDLPLNIGKAEQVLIRRAMMETEGNLSAASRLLGITRPTLYSKLAKMGEAPE